MCRPKRDCCDLLLNEILIFTLSIRGIGESLISKKICPYFGSWKQRWKKLGLLASGRPAQLTSRGKYLRSRGKFLRSRGITLLIRQHITFFEPLVQPFEHFKHSNTA